MLAGIRLAAGEGRRTGQRCINSHRKGVWGERPPPLCVGRDSPASFVERLGTRILIEHIALWK